MTTAKTITKPTNFVELMLTCASWQEAQKIVDSLLAKRFIAGAEFVPVKSSAWWQTKLESSDEIKLIMESTAEYFDKVEAEVAQLRGYEARALQAVPIARLSAQASYWFHETIHQEAA